MFQRLLAFILAVIISTLSSLFGLAPVDTISIKDFKTETYLSFGMQDDMGIITCGEKGEEDSKLTQKLCYEILAQASGGEFIRSGSKRFIEKNIALEAIQEAQEAWATKSFGEPVMESSQQEEFNFQGDFEPALEVAEIIAGDGEVLQNPYTPLDSPEGITQSQIDIASLLEKLDVDFSLGGFDFGVKVTDTGFDLDVGAKVANGVYISKAYSITNFNVSTKFDGNLLTNDIREAYIRADYDLKDITKLTGSYASAVAIDADKLPADAGPVDFMTAAKAGALALMPGGGEKITIFSVNVPIPNLPTVTISLDVNIRLSMNGKIEISITSNNVNGIEIINNKVRVINQVEYNEQLFDIMADLNLTVGLCFSVKALGYVLIDVEFEAGLGVKISAYVKSDTAVYILEMPLDLAMSIPYPTGGMDGAEFCGNAKVFGILKISVGQNSELLKLAGLKKSWDIFDETNGVIYNFHIEESGIVDQCTRART